MNYLYTLKLRPCGDVEIDMRIPADSASRAQRQARAILEHGWEEVWEVLGVSRGAAMPISSQQAMLQVSPHNEMPPRPVSLARQPVDMHQANGRGMSHDQRA